MNPKVYYRVHTQLSLVPILSQMHTVHILPTYFSKIHSNIILPSTPKSFEWSLSFRLSNQNIVCIVHLSHACYMSPSYISLDLIILIIFVEAQNLWSSSLWNLLQPSNIFSLLVPHILLITLLSHTLNLNSSLSMRDEVLHHCSVHLDGRMVMYRNLGRVD